MSKFLDKQGLVRVINWVKNKLQGKVDTSTLSNYYTKTQNDTTFLTKTDATTKYYEKTESDYKYRLKDDSYTKDEVDAKIPEIWKMPDKQSALDHSINHPNNIYWYEETQF